MPNSAIAGGLRLGSSSERNGGSGDDERSLPRRSHRRRLETVVQTSDGPKKARRSVVWPKADAQATTVDNKRKRIDLDFSDFHVDTTGDFEDEFQIQILPGGRRFDFNLTIMDDDPDQPFATLASDNPKTGESFILTMGTAPSGDSTISGTINDADGMTYQIRKVAGDKVVADIVEYGGFPPEHEPERLGETAMDILPVEPLDGSGRRLQEAEIDVMVAYTQKAMCADADQSEGCSDADFSDAIQATIQLAVSETNTGFKNSGINARVRLVASYMVDYTEPKSFRDQLYDLQAGRNGLEGVAAARTTYGADFVVMLVDNLEFCGLSFVGPSSKNAYSVTSWRCATGYYSFGHEIAHNMGCNHDRPALHKPLEDDGDYFYAYQDPDYRFRTVLAYNCDVPTGCPRKNIYSNPRVFRDQKKMGASWADNALFINQHLGAYANYRATKVFPPDAPTQAPAAPTSSPTWAPATALSSITVDKKYYLEGEAILIDYTYGPIPTVLASDYVAVYATAAEKPNPIPLYIYTCGDDITATCPDGEKGMDASTFNQLDDAWPLGVGQYEAALGVNGLRYSNLARSGSFFVVSEHVATMVLDSMEYEHGTHVEVTLTNTNPHLDDWVAVVPTFVGDSVDKSVAEMWKLAACGKQSCWSKTPAYEPPMIEFGLDDDSGESGNQQWPLNIGSYDMVLVSGVDGTVLAREFFNVFGALAASKFTRCENVANFTFSADDGEVRNCSYIGAPWKQTRYCERFDEGIPQNCQVACELCSSAAGSAAAGSCADDPEFSFFANGEKRDCNWFVWEFQSTQHCTPRVRLGCPRACGACEPPCEDNADYSFVPSNVERNCIWIAKDPELIDRYCSHTTVKQQCPVSCGVCDG